MWHEARKHEKKIRVMIVDYRRRAERRREFYEKFKADPNQFLQVHGRPMKIHMDSQISAAAENSMMPWQGNKDNLIDRFDVRAHLDIIPEGISGNPEKEEDPELNYERYRILIQNELTGTGVSEDKFLHQIHLEEQFGGTSIKNSGEYSTAAAAKSKMAKAAIGYNYEDSNTSGLSLSGAIPSAKTSDPNSQNPNEGEESEEEHDFDLLVSFPDLTVGQKAELNQNGLKYGLGPGDFMKHLNADIQEKEDARIAKIHEEEKQAMSGRKARRERRAFKDRIISKKGYVSPPSYAARDEEEEELLELAKRSLSRSHSRSRSPSAEKITYITSFGGQEDVGLKTENSSIGPQQPLPFSPVKKTPTSLPTSFARKSRSSWADAARRTRLRSNSFERKKTSKSHSRSRSRSRSESRSKSPSRSSSRSKSNYSKSKSKSSSHHKRKTRRSSSSSSSTSKSSKSRSRSRSRSKSSTSRSRSNSRSRRRRNKYKKQRRSSSSSSSSRSRGYRRNRKRSRRSPSEERRRRRSSERKSRRSRSSSRDRQRTRQRRDEEEKKRSKKEDENGDSQKVKVPSPPVKRYYTKALEKEIHSRDSQSDHSEDESWPRKETKVDLSIKTSLIVAPTKSGPVASTSTKSDKGEKLTGAERLKRKMQLALNRQLKVDKEAEKLRIEKLEAERIEREESLRELTIKYRRREREKRHRDQIDRKSGSSASSRTSSRSPSQSSDEY